MPAVLTAVTHSDCRKKGIAAGAIFESQTAFLDFFATHVTVDDERRFVIGQNQNSGLETAHTMMEILSERD